MALKSLTTELSTLGTLSPQQLLALGVFTSYFGLIGWLLSKVLVSISEISSRVSPTTLKATLTKGERKIGRDGSRPGGARVPVFWALTVASYAHTWYYMFQYMAGSFYSYQANHPTLASTAFVARLAFWLRDTSLFEEAWYAVCAGKWNWMLSEQLCLFTVGVWTVMLWVEGRRHGIRHVWAYMLLGQVVAISVASNLFYVALLSAPCSPPAKPSSQPSLVSTTSSSKPKRPLESPKLEDDEEDVNVPPTLYVPVLLSLLTVAASPHTSPATFLPNLLLMHTFIVVPLLPFAQPSSPSSWGVSLRTVYYAIFLLNIPIRYRTLVQVASDAPAGVLGWFEHQWVVLHESPAQSSIGWDVVWTTVSFVVWVLVTGGSAQKTKGQEGAVWSRLWKVVYLVFVTPVASVGVTGAYVLRPSRREDEEDVLKED